VYYYNYGFADYSTVNMPKMVDMVKVFCFAIENGKVKLSHCQILFINSEIKFKVAIHCHAGLGRTGLFIACYLIYKFRMSANDAIYYIRDKRYFKYFSV
jgi:protein tyrosine phosphatase domain-containing protein 1